MDYALRNLVFEGGGVKGIAYVGAMEVLEEEGILNKIKRIGGTSAGAINAVLAALKYTRDETLDIMSSLDFNKFMDDSWGVIRDTNRLINHFGWYKGDFFHNWIGELIREKTGNPHATFKEIKDKGFLDLYICGTNLSTRFTEVYSPEHTPRMRVADAVRISMSIPLFFAAIRGQRDDVFVDGGVLRNYPIKLFDREKYIDRAERAVSARDVPYYEEDNEVLRQRSPTSSRYVYNKQTFGFRLDPKEQIALFRDGAEPPHRKIDDLFDYAWALIMTMREAQTNQHLHSDDWHRTVYIDTLGVGTTDFDLSDKLKQELVASGRDNTRQYLDWYNDTETDPAVNHPDVQP